jgi:magnesium transporter
VTFRQHRPPAGAQPSALAIPAGSPPPKVHVFAYDAAGVEERDVASPDELAALLAGPRTMWVDVQGLGDEATLRATAAAFELHPLILADAVNIPQRAKAEPYGEQLLLITRVPLVDAQAKVEVPQVAVIVGPNFVLTFQERYFGFFDPIRARLREGSGPMRSAGPGYLAYALVDVLVDHYFPIVERIAQELEDLEEDVLEHPGPSTLARIHTVRRQLVIIRRIGWPQREALQMLARLDSDRIPPEVRPFLRGVEAHIAQVVELVDSSRDMAMGLLDIHLSNVGQRTNEVMKTLTIMASIFIPLTFVAGIYGMNFEHMPELHSPEAYPVVLVVMAAVAAGMLLYFRRRGWLGNGSED